MESDNELNQMQDNLTYTELLNSPFNPIITPIASTCNGTSSQSNGESDSQNLIRYFLGDISTSNDVSIADPSNIIIDRVNAECNGLPKDAVVEKIIHICNSEVESIEQLRLHYFTIAKAKDDFPFNSAILKRRIHPKSKNGETLVHKLARDCDALRLASKGEYCDDLRDALSNTTARNRSYIDNENNETFTYRDSDKFVRDKLVELESVISELKAANSQNASTFEKKVDDLRSENKKLSVELKKQNERSVNLQHQVNIVRAKCDSVSNSMKSIELKMSDLHKKQMELDYQQKSNEKAVGEIKHSVDGLCESITVSKKTIEKISDNLTKTTSLCKDTKTRLDGEIIRVNKVSDDRASGVCNLKTKVTILSKELKDSETSIENCSSKTLSCIQSITDLRKRVNALERIRPSSVAPNKPSYAETASKQAVEVQINNDPSENRTVISENVDENTSLKHYRMQADRSENEQPTRMSKSPIRSSVSESETNEKPITTHVKTIPVHFPSSVCNNTSLQFKGVPSKKKVSRFYIGGIDKRYGSEQCIREYLSERMIRATHVRYFERPRKRTAAAQVNVIMDDSSKVRDPNFWPSGIFMKPWLSWEKFTREHSIPYNGYR